MPKLTIRAEPAVSFPVYVYRNRPVEGPPDLSARTPYTWTLPRDIYIVAPFQATYDVETGVYYYREGIRVDPYIYGQESPYKHLEFDRVEVDLEYDTYVTVLLREEKEKPPEPPPPPPEEKPPPPKTIIERVGEAWRRFKARHPKIPWLIPP